ncbi:MAG: hypothetical protein KC729_18140, partial [Candidatus Eisenbacteria bacterium]|nr:hypothetical protein [Candidatus Eisenbacteria bacterium]
MIQMIEMAVGAFAGVILLRPFHVLLHELGHAVAVLGLTAATPRVRVGSGAAARVRLGRLQLAVGRRDLACGDCGYDAARSGLGVRVSVAAAGPLLSLLAA